MIPDINFPDIFDQIAKMEEEFLLHFTAITL